MTEFKRITRSTGNRLLISLIIGVLAGFVASYYNLGNIAILLGYDAAVVTFVFWVFAIIWPMGHEQTARFALREDPSRVGADIILILASLASLVAVGFALYEAHFSTGLQHSILTLVGILSVVLSWVLIHTIYTLRYARLYYAGIAEGGVNFKKDHNPTYSDFIYLAFTIGMTFQVADTDLLGSEFRKTVLRHALLAYVFGTVIVATTVSLIAGLGR